jgi:predicted DCC family thiol-disulfide oxidoreductase YuxK
MRNSKPDAIFPLTIYYESACALCNAEVNNLMLRNRDQLLQFVDISDPGFTELPKGASKQDLMDLIHARQADGTLIKGVDVFRHAYRAAGLSWVASGLEMPLISVLAERLYPWLARNRHRIPCPLVSLVFETALRCAAKRTAALSTCKNGSACRY